MNLTLSMFVALYSFQKCPFIIIISCDHKMVEVFRLGEGSPSKEFPCSGFSVKEKTLHSVEKKKKEKKKSLHPEV